MVKVHRLAKLTNASFDDLALDVDACVRYLRGHPQVDAEKIGLWCFSQGGWIAALAAANDWQIAFLIAVSPRAYLRPSK